MALVCRIILLLTLLLAGPRFAAGASPEQDAFDAAHRAYEEGLYPRAQRGFAEFAQTFAGSTNVPRAILMQARALIQLTNYTGAVELLSAHQGEAGPWADQYLFWQGQARLSKSDYAGAAGVFGQLRQQYPGSALHLEACIREASAWAKLAEWPRVVALLQPADSVFQVAAQTNRNAEVVLRGALLLGEACLAQTNYAAAEAALPPLAGPAVDLKLAWQRQYLLCRIEAATGRAPEALEGVVKLLALASATGQRGLLAESAAFQGGLLERLGRLEEAAAAYKANLTEGSPVDRQRQALLKTTELALVQNQPGEAVQILEQFLAHYPKAPAADLALLRLGELLLREHISGAETNRVAESGTNAVAPPLERARMAFSNFTNQFPKSDLLGKAELDLGWCLWLQEKMPESLAAFQAATRRLPASVDLATAHFKLADAEFRLKDYASALSNYTAVAEMAAERGEVRSNLLERALYQTVLAGLQAGNVTAATNALRQLLVQFPEDYHAGRALFQAGAEVSLRDPVRAREIVSQAVQVALNPALLAQARLFIARTYEQEDQWAAAVRLYDDWLAAYAATNAPALPPALLNDLTPRAEYSRARANFRAGSDTNALTQFTNFIARFPTNEFAPLAQWWVGDYYFYNGQPAEAERSYKAIFQNTNLPPSEFTCQAQMMAGRAAEARQGWDAARGYFANVAKLTDVANNTKGSTDLYVQALLSIGHCWMARGPTNDYSEALKCFDKICTFFPTNSRAALAWGGKAECLLQLAQSAKDLEAATNGFQQVLDSTNANVTARSIAKVGMAVALERLAEEAGAEDAEPLLDQAMNCLADVFEGAPDVLRGAQPDPLWTWEAGSRALKLAQQQKNWDQVIRIGRRLQELLPPLRARLEKDILKAQQEQRAQEKS